MRQRFHVIPPLRLAIQLYWGHRRWSLKTARERSAAMHQSFVLGDIRKVLTNHGDKPVPLGLPLYNRDGEQTRRLTTCGYGTWHREAKGGAA